MFKNSKILNFNFISGEELETSINSSSVKFSSNILLSSSLIYPDEISIKQSGGKREHHQFWPLASPIFIFKPSYFPAGKLILP